MAFTQSDLDTLESAIASGTLRVRYLDKEIFYRSLDDMLVARRLIMLKLGLISNQSGRLFPTYSKGTRPCGVCFNINCSGENHDN